ncbi:alpha-E domain-containing protein [Humisphaera borealis]|uniref:Alpha-E domain-containing protein n=1 Tax=Humisphaera borealis TaxID=2807512 RepID=A0A7M2X148_9BACT|nr:alpha-E domain-containing protein [Humisphaera borealis]QOV91423.1 alpha-E domain-containing protein [Humisphaera borealis]
MTPLPSTVLEPVDTIAPKFRSHRASRPMLARDADSMYWMSRYVERSEHVARLLLVNSNLLMDVGELAPTLEQKQWQGLLQILRLDPELPQGESSLSSRVGMFLTFGHDNPNSILNCVTRARENARAIRDNISAEMWESINTLYWSLKSDDARAHLEESPEEFYRHIMTGSMLFQGLTDQTLAHDQGWRFTQLGKYLERADITCRVIETRFHILRSADGVIAGALRNIYWMAVLRSCCAIEFYRRQHVGDMDPIKVASFLILEPNFPRSIRFSVQQSYRAMSAIRAEVNPLAIDPAERVLGRLNADLEYAEANEIMDEGLPNYLLRIQNDLAEAAIAMQKNYFMF